MSREEETVLSRSLGDGVSGGFGEESLEEGLLVLGVWLGGVLGLLEMPGEEWVATESGWLGPAIFEEPGMGSLAGLLVFSPLLFFLFAGHVVH